MVTDMVDTGDAVERRVVALLKDRMDSEAIVTPETKILADTTMDSVKVMDFLLEIEDEFDVTISLNRLSEVETVSDLVKAVHAVIKGN